MKRVLSLVLALIMVFGTIMPAFAEETTTIKTSGEMLESYGLIKGTGNGLDEDQPLKRAEMAVILARLNNKEDIANVYAFPSSFTDVPLSKWYAQPVAYAEAQGWMKGDKKGGTFRPEDFLSAQEVNMLMVRVLGYTDTSWEDANAQAEALEIAVNTKDNSQVMRGEIFKAMTTTLDVPKKGEKETLGTTLALKGYTSPTPVIPEKLEVANVKADNLKTVVIEFNQELLAKSVNTTNFKVTGLTVSKVLLSEDKKTVTLDMSSQIAQSKEIELVITKVKDATDTKTIADYKEKFVVTDVTVPVVESISVIDAKHIKIQASEPMDFVYGVYTVLPGIKIDGNAVIGKVVADNQMNTYTIEFNSVKKEGSYKMTLEGLKDYAKLAAVKKEFSFDVVKDDAAPVAILATAPSVTVVEITFDEPLTTTGTITINGKSTTETFKANSNQKVVLATLAVADKLTLGATVEVNVKYKGQKDVVGNEVKTESSLTFKVADDTTMPTASVEVKAGNKMVFTFSKAMDTTLGKVIVLDKDKKVKKEVNVSGLGTWNTDKTVLTVVATSLDTSGFMISNTDPAEAYLQLKDMKDSTVRANLLVTTDLSVTLLDTKKPTVSSLYVKKAGIKADKTDDTITFFFSEMMDEDSVKNLSNYLKAGTTPLSGTSGVAFKSFSTDQKSVTITVPGARDFTTAEADKFVVIAVKDSAGNMILTDISNKIGMSEAGVALDKIKGAIATKTTQVKVEFPVEIKSIDPAALAVYNTGTTTAYSIVSSIASIDGKFVTIDLVTALTTNAGVYDVRVVSPTLITSTYDAKFVKNLSTDDTFNIVDQIAPTVASLADGMWDGAAVVASKNYAVIKMSEAVEHQEFVQSNLVVKLNDKILDSSEYSITHVINSLYYNIKVNPTAKVTLDGVYTLSVQLVRNSTNVKDTSAAHNILAPFTKSITDFDYDATSPTVLVTADKTVAKDGDTVIFTATFSEAVKAGVVPQITLTGGQTVGPVVMTKTSDLVWTYSRLMAGGGNSIVKAQVTVAVDASNNPVTGEFATQANDTTVVADNTGSTVLVTANKTVVNNGTSVIFTATFSEAVKTGVIPKMALTGGETLVATEMVKTSDTIWTLTHTMASGANTTVQAQTTLAVDAAGNAATGNFAGTANLTTVVSDNIAPVLTGVATNDTDNDGKIEYTLTFGEAILDSTFTSTNFLVKDTVSDLTGTGTSNDVTYVIEANTVDTSTMAITYTQGTLTDAAGNLVVTTTVTDGSDDVEPVLVSATLSNEGAGVLKTLEATDAITLVFSESMDTATIADLTVGAMTVGADPFDNSFVITRTAGGAVLATVNVSTDKAIATSVAAGASTTPTWTGTDTVKILLNGVVTGGVVDTTVDGTLTTVLGVGAVSTDGEAGNTTATTATVGQF